MAKLVRSSGVQLVVATHSPVLLTFPNASLLSLDGGRVAPIRLEDTSHYQVTKGILDSPERYWEHLLADDDPG
jgi:predicted ATPase